MPAFQLLYYIACHWQATLSERAIGMFNGAAKTASIATDINVIRSIDRIVAICKSYDNNFMISAKDSSATGTIGEEILANHSFDLLKTLAYVCIGVAVAVEFFGFVNLVKFKKKEDEKTQKWIMLVLGRVMFVSSSIVFTYVSIMYLNEVKKLQEDLNANKYVRNFATTAPEDKVLLDEAVAEAQTSVYISLAFSFLACFAALFREWLFCKKYGGKDGANVMAKSSTSHTESRA